MKSRNRHYTPVSNKKSSTPLITSMPEIREAVQAEWDSRIEEVYDTVKADVTVQVLAVACCVLNKEFGFGKSRLQQFKSGIEGIFQMIIKSDSPDFFWKSMSTEDCISYLKDMGIEIDPEKFKHKEESRNENKSK